MLKSGAGAHAFTPEERAKGGRARAEKLRERREATKTPHQAARFCATDPAETASRPPLTR